MARILSDEEVVRLLAMPEAEARAWVDANISGFGDSMTAKALLIKRRKYAADNPIPGFETTTLATFGIGAGTAAVVTARVAELIKGSTTTYEAVLDLVELGERLQTVLGQEFSIHSFANGEIVVVGNDRGLPEICQIRVAVSGGKTAVIVGGLNLTEVKQGAGNVVDSLLNLGRRALQGRNVVEGAFDVLGGAVGTVGQAGKDLNTANKIADTIEKYGAEVERATVEAARKVAVKVAEEKELKQKENNCTFCGSARTLGQACPSCGATETA